jgi:hypothetical protein
MWVAMEAVDGAQTLAAAIATRGPIPPDQAADLIAVIGEALIEAAQVGVVHRDLAPKNVLFAGSDVKLINFSLPVPTNDKVPGVPEFVSPEQVDGRPVDQRSNLYSLGALYYFVLTGKTVFSGSADEVHRQHASGVITPPSQLARVPAPVETVIMRALDRSPTKRFLTVRQFVDEVGRVGHGEVIELKQAAPQGRPRPKPELMKTLMGGMSPIAAAPTVGSGTPAIAAPVVHRPPTPQPVQTAPSPMAQTAFGVPSAAGSPGNAAGPAMGSGATSPWSPPVQQAPAVAPPVVAPPVVAAPVVAAPVVAAPVVGAPQVAAQPAGKKRAEEPGTKGKFRETMWFKKGELDAQAAQAAADERARTGKDVAADKADSLPIDERYKDDGSITRGDAERYSLRTGATQMMMSVQNLPDERGGKKSKRVSEDALIGEMKGGRIKVILAILLVIGLGVAAVVLTR